MKRFVVLLLSLGLMYAASAGAATIINTCTSTYQIDGFLSQLSGWDTAAVTTDSYPIIVVAKSAANLRNGYSGDIVPARPGDTIEFTIVWQDNGGPSDTVTLTDYIPSGLTYVAASVTDTEANCDTPGIAVYDGAENKIIYITNTVKGTESAPNNGNGIIKFRATVD